MSPLLEYTISKILTSDNALYRWLTANDIGISSNQSGILIPAVATKLAFDKTLITDAIFKKNIKIEWQMGECTTDSVFTYYASKNERRLTYLRKYKPLFNENNIGSLFVLIKENAENYYGVLLSSDEDIDGFFAYFNLVPGSTNQLIVGSLDEKLRESIVQYAEQCDTMPSTIEMSTIAQGIYNYKNRIKIDHTIKKCDSLLLAWYNTEQLLYNEIESHIFYPLIEHKFKSVHDFLEVSKTLENSRKSRAGKSLEHHLSKIFQYSNLKYSEQSITEDNKKPDFIFPSIEDYHNLKFSFEGLTFMGAKTTCKDRWRQVLNEADRIPAKHLFTLQRGVSESQLSEMEKERLTLVVPAEHKKSFPRKYHEKIMTLAEFINSVHNKQDHYKTYFMM